MLNKQTPPIRVDYKGKLAGKTMTVGDGPVRLEIAFRVKGRCGAGVQVSNQFTTNE